MNFVCLVFELGDKTLTLSPMENLMVKCNLHMRNNINVTSGVTITIHVAKSSQMEL